MSAIAYAETGPTDVLQMTEQPVPVLAPGEVLVRIHRSGLNPSDAKSRSGWGGMTVPGPLAIPNNDGAGVDPARMGARVWLYEATREGRDRGTSAQFVAVRERFAVDLPDGVSFDVGAALGVPAMTAHRALFADGPIEGEDGVRHRRRRRGRGEPHGGATRRMGRRARDHDDLEEGALRLPARARTP